MKFFQLTDTGFRSPVNMKIFENDIAKAVAMITPEATPYVENTYFYTVPELGKRQSILVSRELRKHSLLNNYTMERPCLFSSTQRLSKKYMEEKNNV